MATVQIDGLESNDNLDQPQISSALTLFFVRRRPRLPVFLHWLVFVSTLIAFPLALAFSMFILNRFFTGTHFVNYIFFLVLLCASPLSAIFIIDDIIFVLEGHFTRMRKKSLYLLFHVQNSLFYLVCSTQFLLLWILLIKPDWGINLCNNFITAAIGTSVLGSTLWIIKILILKIMFSNYHGKGFFDNMDRLIDQEYVLKALLFGVTTKLYTVCSSLHTPFGESRVNALYHWLEKIFTNKNPRIQGTDLLRYIQMDNVAEVLGEAEFISLASLNDWMLNFSEERKTLIGLFNDTNTAIEDIDPIISLFLGALLPFAWFYFTGFTTPKLLSVTALLGLLLSLNKHVLDGIIFVFKEHRFDIGDHIVVDDQELVVKDIGIITTELYTRNKKIVSFTNSNLTTKSVTNITRSPMMSETVAVDVSNKTLDGDIKRKLEAKIDKFLESKPETWSRGHSLLLKQVDNKTPKYVLQVAHSSKFENYEQHDIQRLELLDKVMEILKELGIEYLSVK